MPLMNDPAKAKEHFEAKLAFTTGPMELEHMMRDGEVNVVDVRAAEDYDREHIPGSVNLPRDRWKTHEGVTKDKTNVVLCYSIVCHLAARACVELAAEGYSVMELDGGFKSYKEHKLPTVSTPLSKQLQKSVADLRAMADEIRAGVQRAGNDAKETWAHLEPRIERLEQDAKNGTDAAAGKLRDAAMDLRVALRTLREKVI